MHRRPSTRATAAKTPNAGPVVFFVAPPTYSPIPPKTSPRTMAETATARKTRNVGQSAMGLHSFSGGISIRRSQYSIMHRYRGRFRMVAQRFMYEAGGWVVHGSGRG